ncbi:DNA topoisomerase IB [Sphingobacterium griseoflavum]|uniref:DNA topoisomerase n=1 Tax=Sphingobacterium griseoflavum TaxID=1474952 RepID=A0ABQ3HZP8_9SPHI|nr:DNA topoisomerase IB [Sphingobacterium griseoflavum]GHE35404.1 DNA topoisomerase [Sphingobacterium griseoflavum]
MEVLEGNEELLALQEAGIRYVSCNDKGICRVAEGKVFRYVDKSGNPVTNERILQRIQALVLPPAWTDVWICSNANGHLQATGIDVRGRKQYRYHPKWVALRSEKKFFDLYAFGMRLPVLLQKVQQDLRKRTFSKEKVCALAVSVMQRTSFRVGNKHYEQTNGSYGLTTLKNKHLQKLSASKVFFKFIGKKGVVQEAYFREKTLIKMLLKVKDLPGQRIFQYYDEHGNVQALESGDINDYLKQSLGLSASCKNFRTWNGCLLALKHMAEKEIPSSITARKKSILETIDYVAATLGNTRSVTRSHYVHPRILNDYEVGKLDNWIKRTQRKSAPVLEKYFERKLLAILKMV